MVAWMCARILYHNSLCVSYLNSYPCFSVLQKEMTTKNLDQNTFPVYAIQSINDKYFVCAGGGGAAKTGVKNAIKLYRLDRKGKTYEADCICDFDTGPRAVMNLDISPQKDVLAVGMDHICQLYKIDYTKEGETEKVILKDIGCVSTVPESTCENEDGEYQKCIRFTPDKRYIVTGGSDGSCKVFKYPSFEKQSEIFNAHKTELDEIDVHPNSKVFVTVSKDSCAGLWGVKDGKKQLELSFSVDKKDDDFYRFRNCRFSTNQDSKDVHLYTTHIPRKYTRAKAQSCLVKWDTQKWIPQQNIFIQSHIPSSLNVSHRGTYLGIGTAEGSILVYISWNMRHLRTVNAIHDSFITGLSFLPESKVLCEDLRKDGGVLTCSIDNNCTMTLLPARREYSMTVILFFFILVIMVMFNIITYFDMDF